MAPGARRLKRESTIAHSGLITPDQSIYGAGTVSPKREVDMESVSDVLEDHSFQGMTQHDGLPSDEGYQSTVVEQQRRSVSLRPAQIPPTPDVGLGLNTMASNSGLALVGRDTKKLIDAIDELRKIGLKSVDTKLPELVLIGDQSAGKSSLMGAIAEINLPKGTSICTRCPTNIKTSDAATWGCAVSLQISYDFLPGKKAGLEFPNWSPSEDVSTIPFKTIYDKSELENLLKWAQIALLNPREDPRSFIPGTDEHTQRTQYRSPNHNDQANFSPNVITVEISGPGLPSLSFFDLPGLFSTAENAEQQYLVNVFEKMTKKYIQHENALIICTITMQNDPGLSKTKAVISKYHADDRCIGVLTMPDRLQSDSAHKDYDRILKGETYVLQPHGYFVTRQPGTNTKLHGPTYHIDARMEEKQFFDTDPLWSGAWSHFRSRCGTETIQKYLSKQFANLILQSIPDISDKVRIELLQVDEELSRLPETPNDKVQHIVRQRLMKFSQSAKDLLDGNSASQNNRFHLQWTTLYGQFQKATEVMRPGCVFTTPFDMPKVVINLDESDDDGASRHSSSTATKRPNDSSPNDSFGKRQRLQTTPTRPGGGFIKREAGFTTPQRPAALKRFKPSEFGPFYQDYLTLGQSALTLVDIRQSIAERGRAGMPDFDNYKIREDYALVAVNPWKFPLETFIDHTFRLLRLELQSILRSVLQSYEQTGLYRQSKEILEKFLLRQETEQRAISMEFYKTEAAALFTINQGAFDLHKAEALAILQQQRRNRRVDCFMKNHPESEFKNADAREAFRNKVTDADLGPDPFAKELDIAAYIKGYYTTARLRFVDSVCANMMSSYFGKIKEQLSYLLEDELGLDRGDSEAKCQQLLEGNEEIAIKRVALKKKRKQLLEFSGVLEKLNRDIYDADLEAEHENHHQDDDAAHAIAVDV